MFLGAHINGLDAKGRASAPAEFRAVARADGLDGVYCWPSIDGGYLEGCGARLMTRFQTMLDDMDAYDPTREDFALAVLGRARQLSFDATGRVTLPKSFIAEAGLEDQVAFVGLGDRFQVWNPQRHAAQTDAALTRLRRNKDKLRPPGGGHRPNSAQGAAEDVSGAGAGERAP